MKKYMENSLKFYDLNSKEYAKQWNKDVEKELEFTMPKIFLSYLKEDSKLLDLGCGSGRDSKYFLSKGYDITSIDGSKKMCEIASDYIGKKVICKNFLDLEYIDNLTVYMHVHHFCI